MSLPLVLKTSTIYAMINNQYYMGEPDEKGVYLYIKFTLPQPDQLRVHLDHYTIEAEHPDVVLGQIHRICDVASNTSSPFGTHFSTRYQMVEPSIHQRLLEAETAIEQLQQQKYQLMDQLQLIDLQLTQLEQTKQSFIKQLGGDTHA